MKIYLVKAGDLPRLKPEIKSASLRKDGLYIGIPDVIIFRSEAEAEACIKAAHRAIELNQMKEVQNDKIRRMPDRDDGQSSNE